MALSIVVVVLLIAVFPVDLIAKFGALGGWSTFFDVATNLLLIGGAITAFVLGIRTDRRIQASDPDNDY